MTGSLERSDDMFQQAVKPRIVAGELFNLTRQPFAIYDSATGVIWKFPPIGTRPAKRKQCDFYVMEGKNNPNGSEENICIIERDGVGRNETVVSRITLASDHSREVCIKDYHGKNGIETKN